MISQELSRAIIEGDIHNVRFVLLKENVKELSTAYIKEAFELANHHQRTNVSDCIQQALVYNTLIELNKRKGILGFEIITALTNQKMLNIIEDINAQLYKFYDSMPGKFIAIDSSIALLHKFSLNATRGPLGEYQIIVHKNTEDVKQRKYYQITKEGLIPWEPNIQYNEQLASSFEKEAKSFIERIKTTYFKFNQRFSELPIKLEESITRVMLSDIYHYILNKAELLEKLASGRNFRIDKRHSGLKRTFNILLNHANEYMLILETKRKKHDDSKDDNRKIGEGAYGTVKPAWRVDIEKFEEWANKTIQGSSFIEAEYEATFSQNIIKDCGAASSELFNSPLLGEVFYNQTPKRSLYSIRAIGDLEKILKNDKDLLNLKNILVIFGDVLNAINTMHQNGKVHQDIKAQNILIYKGERYFAKLADFGISEDTRKPVFRDAFTTIYYVSPEILIGSQSKKSDHYSIFHSNPLYYNQFAYVAYKNTLKYKADDNDPVVINYRLPDPSNDMWALGILLFKLLHRRYPDYNDRDHMLIQEDPLLSGLLQIERENRMTIKKVLEIYPEWLDKQLINPPVITSAYDSESKPKGSPSRNEWTVMTADGPIPLSYFVGKHAVP